MKLQDCKLYMEDVAHTAALDLPWEMLDNKSVLITGASGMIGSCLTDVLAYLNTAGRISCRIWAAGRNVKRGEERFSYCLNEEWFRFISCDINDPMGTAALPACDYIIHLASNTHPVAYSTDPIGTIASNMIGTYNLLELAVRSRAERFVFASSNEIYGENRGDVEKFKEDYCGYIDSNTLRAGYPESKRCGEALCQAYRKQRKLDVVIPRLTRTYGPTMLMTDTKAISQFIKNGIRKESIILKSKGTQYYSYTYVADAVSGLLTVMLKGQEGEAYNIADEASDIMLKDLAQMIADECGVKVEFRIPDETEKSGFSVVTKARLDGEKLHRLGWRAETDLEQGLRKTIRILRGMTEPEGA